MEPVAEALGRLHDLRLEPAAHDMELEAHDLRAAAETAAAIGADPGDLDSAAIGHPLFDVGEFASYLTAAGEVEARGRFLEACGAGRDARLFEAVALLRWSSLPFRDLEPDLPDKVRRRVELARERLADYRRSASSVITAS
jgi:hypothetical protein